MKKIFILAAAVIMMVSTTSCDHKKTKQDYVKDAFEEYVKTDFDDPSDFIEVTDVQAVDTLNKTDALETIQSFSAIAEILTSDQIQKLSDYKSELDTSKVHVITYLVKARIKDGCGGKEIKKYYVLDNGKDMKVQDHLMTLDEAPEPYGEFFKYAGSILGI